MRLTTLLALLLVVPPLLAQGPAPGFGGLHWGDPPGSDMKRLEGTDAGLSYYSRGPALSYCGTTVAVRYLFYRQRLLSVGLNGFARELPAMRTCLTKTWGTPRETRGREHWSTPDTRATLESRPPERGGGYHVLIVSKSLWSEFLADEAKDKAKAKGPTPAR